MDEKVFDRVEKKYLINAEKYRRILPVVKKHMGEDNYYKSEVFNLYFDTDNYDLIIQSIEHPEFKEKLRARAYGGYDKVFLEIKTKLLGKENNVGYKRRVLITRKDFDKLVAGKADVATLAAKKIETAADQQIATEVDYMISYFGLKPKILVYYDRESYKGENALRITFDTGLKYRTKNLKFVKKAGDRACFSDENRIIMEIKAHGVLPIWLVKALSAEQIYPQRFSKIGTIYEKIRKENNV